MYSRAKESTKRMVTYITRRISARLSHRNNLQGEMSDFRLGGYREYTFPTFTDPIFDKEEKFSKYLFIRYFRGTEDVQRWDIRLRESGIIIESENNRLL